MVGRALSEHIAKQNEKLQKLNLCTNCQWVSKVGHPDSWKCKHPNHIKTNYVTGIVEFYDVYCDQKNVSGKCSDYEMEPYPDTSSQITKNTVETNKKEKISIWKILWNLIYRWL